MVIKQQNPECPSYRMKCTELDTLILLWVGWRENWWCMVFNEIKHKARKKNQELMVDIQFQLAKLLSKDLNSMISLFMVVLTKEY